MVEVDDFQDDGSGGTGVHLTRCIRLDFLGDAFALAFVGVVPLPLVLPLPELEVVEDEGHRKSKIMRGVTVDEAV